MKAQQMFEQGREKVSAIHKFPALPPVCVNRGRDWVIYSSSWFFSLQDLLHAREVVRRAQKSLEEKQRQEEDQLFMKFRNNRQLEEKKIEQEVTDEWEKKLQMLTAKYEDELRRKKDKNIERVKIFHSLDLD